MAITDSPNAILAPAISSRACVVMRKIIPGGATSAVVFPHCPPLPLAQVRTPPFPVQSALSRFLQPLFLFGKGLPVGFTVLSKLRHLSSRAYHRYAAALTALATAGAPPTIPKMAP